MPFIPANSSKAFTRLFRPYARVLFKRRFKNVWIHQEYTPGPDENTVYFLNHSSWWDGLIPLMLNEYKFRQRAHAMMEFKQMRKYRFFRWLGAFSIDPADIRHVRNSLTYALGSMQRINAALYIYPQSKIIPAGSKMHFKKGIIWLHKQLSNADFVPIGIYIHTVRHDKPELHIWVGKPVLLDSNVKNEVKMQMEQKLDNILNKLHTTAGFNDTFYDRFW